MRSERELRAAGHPLRGGCAVGNWKDHGLSAGGGARWPDFLLGVAYDASKRDSEVDGRDYFFVDEPEFRRLVVKGEFLEWAEYNAHFYGTRWGAIDRGLAGGRELLLEIEVQGARQVRARRPDARLVFLLPPSMEKLERRLQGRGTDSAAEILQRLEVANRELEAIGDFDYAVTNDDLERCVANLLEIIRAERDGSVDELRERFSPAAADEKFRSSRLPSS